MKQFITQSTENHTKLSSHLEAQLNSTKAQQTIYNNCNNQNMTINVFLNEQCKDALNLTDFVQNIKVTLEDLQYTKDNGFVNGFVNGAAHIITKQLQDLEPTQRPIHCSDKKRLQFYVKDDDKWGKEKTDNYYSRWNKLSNGQLENGPYIDLFSHSDAMITDSASFIAEYLYFNKPLCFTMKDNNVKNRFNSFGKIIFDYLYTSNDSLSTEFFINNVIIEKNDYLKESRSRFFKETILSNSGRTASENIYNELIHELC